MTLTANTITALLFILFGLAVCFSGYRLFRFYLMAMGFVFGFMAVLSRTNPPMDYTNLTMLVVAVVVGIVIALLVWLLYRFGVAIAGAMLGFVVGAALVQALNITGDIAAPLVVIVCIIIGLMLAFVIADMIVMVGTAIIGANLVAMNLGVVFPDLADGSILLIVTLVLAALGFVTQWQWAGRRKRALV